MQTGIPMRLALLMTNTDESGFAHRHPLDAEKFASLIAAVRPDWSVESFAVKDGVFPGDPGAFDGVMIGGSPASVHDGRDWIARLLGLIRELVAQGMPLFGACFGPQAIALALGGRVGPNPGGWGLGSVATEVDSALPWMEPRAASFRLHAAHKEQVTRLPEGASAFGRSRGCDVAGFTIGSHVFTTQYHPEITAGFMAALLDEMAPTTPAEDIAHARASLADPAQNALFAEWIARFFETARGR